ncbi:MAG: Mitochondrial zinc maintenance protein 1, mitochondrial [Alyxoria varia]|nr:MAG: Mitochondrial zinc maintenance protein 1, mitochondrial [Alyxoria varia]
MLNGARMKARRSFEESRNLQSDSEAVQQGVKHAEDVAKILRQNVVQGTKAGEADQFKLRIHDDTERGDNENVKVAGQELREKSPS